MVSTFSFRLRLLTSAILVLGLALMVSCQEEEVKPPADETLVNGEEVSTRPPLTGIPQIDYIWDPNLPRELNGFNLSSYPFYRSIPPPDKMQFECDGLHDGFYASVVHKCQVYHQCLFGQRYDFLCANFTAFDQKNFICHFANEVDCNNSPKFFDRNEALYKTTSTTPLPTAPPIVVRTRFVGQDGRPLRRPGAGRFRRPNANRRPVYYDDYYDYDYQEYDYVSGAEEEDPAQSKNGTENAIKSDAPLEEEAAAPVRPVKAGGGRQRPGAGQGNRGAIFNNNRPPPRIRPPVPNSEAKKPTKPTKPTTTTPAADEFYDYVDYADGEQPLEEAPASTTTTTTTTTTAAPPPPQRRRFRRPKTTTTSAPLVEEFVEEEFVEDVAEPVTTTQQPRRAKVAGPRRQSTTTTEATTSTTTAVVESAAPVEEEPAEQPSNRRNSLFNRRTSANNLLRRRINTASTQTPAEEDVGNEEELMDEPIEEVITEVLTTSTTTTTTTPAPSRRTTRARPTRPANTPRTRAPTEAPVLVEEEPATTAIPAVVENVEPVADPLPIEVEAPVRRGRPRRPQVVEEDVAPAAPVAPVAPVARRGAQRRGSQAVVAEVDQEIPVEDQNIRQGRDLVDVQSPSKIVLEESTNFDEDLGESQWSIINLFSRVFPQRA